MKSLKALLKISLVPAMLFVIGCGCCEEAVVPPPPPPVVEPAPLPPPPPMPARG